MSWNFLGLHGLEVLLNNMRNNHIIMVIIMQYVLSSMAVSTTVYILGENSVTDAFWICNKTSLQRILMRRWGDEGMRRCMLPASRHRMNSIMNLHKAKLSRLWVLAEEAIRETMNTGQAAMMKDIPFVFNYHQSFYHGFKVCSLKQK